MKFHEVQISDRFRWRGETWVKTDQTHATSEDAPGEPEHVPSHEEVKNETTVEVTSEPTTN